MRVGSACKSLICHRFIVAFETITLLVFLFTFWWLPIDCSWYSLVSTWYILYVWWGFWLVKTQYLPTSFTRRLLRGRDVTRYWDFQNFFCKILYLISYITMSPWAVLVMIGFQLSIKYVLIQNSDQKMTVTKFCLWDIINSLIEIARVNCFSLSIHNFSRFFRICRSCFVAAGFNILSISVNFSSR